MKTVTIIGLGYVGLPLALLAGRKGFSVIGIDINEDRVKKINAKQSPFTDNRLAEEMLASNIKAVSDFSDTAKADVIVICVPTPVHENHQPNLEPVINACKSIGPYLKRGQLVVLESTVNPGVSEEIVLPTLEEHSGLKAGVDFYLAHCPERINPGDIKWVVANIPRVVGSLEEKGLGLALDFYSSLIDAPIKPMASLKEAEAVKIVENSFRDINIAFVNELAMSFHSLGIDVTRVIEGASTKPFAFMPHFPGCGVGGHCIPVDPYYLIEYAKRKGFDHAFLSLARKINNHMPAFSVDLLVSKLQEQNIEPRGAKVALLGLSYKPDVDDDRESPAYKILEEARGRGINITAYDPFIDNKDEMTLEKVLEGASAAIIATAHSMFKALTPQIFEKHGVSIVVDGRNCLDKAAFAGSSVAYQGIGR